MPCPRCGDPTPVNPREPDIYHFPVEHGGALECNLYALGTQLKRIADSLERLAQCVIEDKPLELRFTGIEEVKK